MADLLTVPEVERHVREAMQALHGLPLSVRESMFAGNRIALALDHLNELQWLCELVRNVDAGLAVVVDADCLL